MTTVSDSAPVSVPRKPLWKNPYLLGFLVGAALLTVLPLLQRRMLTAPAPLASLPEWTLEELTSKKTVTSGSLKGTVWVVSFYDAECAEPCQQRQADFAKLARHLEDLQAKVAMVSLRMGPSQLPEAPATAQVRWLKLTGSEQALTEVTSPFREALRMAPSTVSHAATPIQQLPLFALVDQNGAVRGFWPVDTAGRGNLVSAARLLAKYGPTP